jgi:hypothetical protein
VKPLLVGEANPYGADPRCALYPEPPSSAGGRLCRQVLGLEPREYLRLFDRANLCPQRWSVREARVRAEALLDERRPAYVLLGRKVAEAFGFGDRAPFSTVLVGYSLIDGGADSRVYLLPHPSGLCREWNVPGAFERARRLLSPFLPDWCPDCERCDCDCGRFERGCS